MTAISSFDDTDEDDDASVRKIRTATIAGDLAKANAAIDAWVVAWIPRVEGNLRWGKVKMFNTEVVTHGLTKLCAQLGLDVEHEVNDWLSRFRLSVIEYIRAKDALDDIPPAGAKYASAHSFMWNRMRSICGQADRDTLNEHRRQITMDIGGLDEAGASNDPLQAAAHLGVRDKAAGDGPEPQPPYRRRHRRVKVPSDPTHDEAAWNGFIETVANELSEADALIYRLRALGVPADVMSTMLTELCPERRWSADAIYKRVSRNIGPVHKRLWKESYGTD